MNSTFLCARKWSQCDSASVGVAVQLFGPADLFGSVMGAVRVIINQLCYGYLDLLWKKWLSF